MRGSAILTILCGAALPYLSAGLSSKSFGDTSWGPKSIVSGLTAFVKVFTPAADAERLEARRLEREALPAVTPRQLTAKLREDFSERGYLFTGEISSEIYDDDCVFTDPTLSFVGLETFERNLAALQPILNVLLGDDRRVILRKGPELNRRDQSVEAQWRMSGAIRLPWKPRIELNGATKFSYDPSRKGRIVRYDETWEISAADALLQLFKRGEKLD